MSTIARLAAFAAGLAATLAASFAIGAAFGPDTEQERAPATVEDHRDGAHEESE